MFRYDPHGLHFAELARLALTHPAMFTLVAWLIDRNLKRVALALAAHLI